MDGALAGRVAWVTGGASGIGLATVMRLQAMGARVAILDIARPDDLPDTLEVHHCDVGDRGSVEAAGVRLRALTGPADILVHCAAISGRAPVSTFPDALWDRIIGINLTGSFNMARLVLGDMMERRWGRIILFTSDVVRKPTEGQAAYISSKAGVIALSHVLAIEGGAAGVTCNTLSPGFVDTPQTRKRFGSREELQRIVTETGAANPMGAVLEADDLANAAAFLCHPDSRHITGQTLHVNAGMVMC
jgi:NAD(P)-dependent dehydrogenase (short-subunit alcohol dehydrogenase family)